MKSTQSKFICASSALVMSFAMMAGTAEAKKRVKHDWDVNPAAYAPDGLGDYGTETVKVVVKKAKHKVAKKAKHKKAHKVASKRRVKKVRKIRYDWQINPEAYAPDGLSDYGMVAVQTVRESRPVAFSIKADASSKSQHDWQINPAAYAPDGLNDYVDQLNTGKSGFGMVQSDRKTAPNA